MTCKTKQNILFKARDHMEKTEKSKVPRPAEEKMREQKDSVHTAEQKCRAVLSLWTERRKPGQVCRDLGITWNVLNQWEERAMEGMLLALQPRTTQMEKMVALNSRLAVLLERKSKEGSMKGLERRLARLQKSSAKPVESQETGAEKKI